MSLEPIAYVKGAHHANAGISPTADGRFQGSVTLSHGGPGESAEKHVVPVCSDTPEEAMEEAKALAHRLLADLQ